MDDLNILAWNCHSLYPKLSEFKIRLYATRPHVAVLCETWMKATREPTFINYTTVFKHRPDRIGGGLAFLIRNDLSFDDINLIPYADGNLEVQAIQLFGSKHNLDILSVYNPNKVITVEEFDHYVEQLGSHRIMLGDFNAHHFLWDSRCASNTTGNNLVSSLLNHPDMCLLTPCSLPTYYHVQTGGFSTLDLCFVSVDLYPSSEVSLQRDLGSDHEPVQISISYRPSITLRKRRPRWIFDDSLWDTWSSSLPVAGGERGELVDEYSRFEEALLVTSKKVFKQSKEVINPKYSKIWWTPECETLVQKRHTAKNKLKNHPTSKNLIALRKAEALAKRETKLAKKNYTRQFVSSINSQTPCSTLWKLIEAFSNKTKNPRRSPFYNQNNVITCPKTKCNIIADRLEELLNSHRSNADATSLLLPLALALTEDSEPYEYNRPFQLFELEDTIKVLKNTSPGHDMVQNSMLKNLTKEYRSWALDIMNDSFEKTKIPDTWKQQLIIPILKPGKPPSDPKSYRPISLLPCFPKLMEKMICARLNFYLEKNNMFSETQAGFRKRSCTIDQISRMENTIRVALFQRKTTIAVFFDLSNAYDTVWHTGLLAKLARCGIRGCMLKWIKEYLTDRKFRVFFEGAYSSERSISSGVPQGSILGPLLFNIMMRDIPSEFEVHRSEFADDVAVYISGHDVEHISARIQEQIDLFYRWTRAWGLTVNPSKIKAMIFTNKRITPPELTINEEPVEFVQTHSFLGMKLDSPKLLWKEHIQYLRDSCVPRLNIMKSLSNNHWGADREVLLKFYQAVIRSKLDYGAIFYCTAAKTQLEKLDKIQNNALRIALGARRTSPVASLEAESNVPPLSIHRELVQIKYYCRTVELPINVPVNKELFYSYEQLAGASWSSRLIPPFLTRGVSLFTELGLSVPPRNPVTLISPIPPWTNIRRVLCPEFCSLTVNEMTNNTAKAVFIDIQNSKYPSFLELYTDGSVIREPEVSVTAAVVVKKLDTTEYFNWKLPVTMTILGAELYAIKQALDYINSMECVVPGVVIYSDSMSSIQILSNRTPNNYMNFVFPIQETLLQVNKKKPVIIQFVPAHKDIEGNELADLAANAAHSLETTAEVIVSKEDRVREVKALLRKRWENQWHESVRKESKGMALLDIKSEIGYWPWASHQTRVVETIMTRFRIGHVGLNNHLYRFKMSDTNLCLCGLPETIDHYLLECRNHKADRDLLVEELEQMQVPFSKKNILGGGDFPLSVQRRIVNCFVKYVTSTGKLWKL